MGGHEFLSLYPNAKLVKIVKGGFYKLVFMFISGCLFCLDDFGLSFASVSFSFSHDARIAPSFIRDFCCMIASKSPQANL